MLCRGDTIDLTMELVAANKKWFIVNISWSNGMTTLPTSVQNYQPFMLDKWNSNFNPFPFVLIFIIIIIFCDICGRGNPVNGENKLSNNTNL